MNRAQPCRSPICGPATVAASIAVMVLCPAIGSASAFAAQQESEQEIAALVSQLGADQFAVRQAAMNRLIAIGAAAIAPIREAMPGGEPEMLIRSMEILQRMAVSEDSTASELALNAILELTKDSNGHLARMADQTVERLVRPLQARAIGQLQKLGANVSSVDMVFGNQQIASYTIELGPRWKGTRANLGLLAQIPDTTELKLIGAEFDDSVIADVSRLPRLGFLKVKDASITNDAIKALGESPTLGKLELVYCNVDDQCLADLRKIASLSIVNLFGTRISESAVDQLKITTGWAIDWRRGAMLGVRYQLGARPCQLTDIVENSAAQAAGLQVGDIIVGYDDKTIETAEDFRGCVANNSPGDKVSITVLREGETLTKTVELGRFANIEF